MKHLSLLLFGLMLFTASFASHIKGGQITYEHIQGDTFRVNMTLIRDCAGIFAPPTAVVNLNPDCGSAFNLTLSKIGTDSNYTNICSSLTTTCNGGTYPGLDAVRYSAVTTLTCNGGWLISYSICCMSSGITNISNSATNNFYLEAYVKNSYHNSSPRYGNDLSMYLQATGGTVDHNIYDPEGDSLYSTFVAAKVSSTSTVSYTTGYSSTSPMSNISLDSQNGNLTIGANAQGFYLNSIKTYQYADNGDTIGYINRVFPIGVMSTTSSSSSPTSNGHTISSMNGSLSSMGNNTYSVCPGDSIFGSFSFYDTASFNLTLSSDISGLTHSSTTSNDTTTISFSSSNLTQGVYSITALASTNACPANGIAHGQFILIVNDGVSAGNDQTICLGDTASLSGSVPGSASGLTWHNNNGAYQSCTNCATPSVAPTTTTTFYLTANGSNLQLCDTVDQVTITVVDPSTFNLTASISQGCPGDYVQVTASNPNYFHHWNSSSAVNFCPTCPSDSFMLYADATIIGTWQVNSGCSATDTVLVDVTGFNQQLISNSVLTICEGDSVSISSNTISPQWSSMMGDPLQLGVNIDCDTCADVVVSPSISTVFEVIETFNGCTASDSILIEVMPNDILSNTPLINCGNGVTLGASGAYSNVQWSVIYGSAIVMGSNFGCDSCSYTWANPADTTMYVVQGIHSGTGCGFMDTVTVYPTNDRTISGVLTTSTGNALELSDVYAIVYNGSDSTVSIHAQTTTDLNGEYSMNVTADTVWIKAYPNPNLYASEIPTYSNGATTFLSADSTITSACNGDTVSFATLNGVNSGLGFIAGNVYQGAGKTGAEGDPIVNLEVILMNENNIPVGHQVSDINGAIRFEDLPAGTYSFYADHPLIDNMNASTIVLAEGEQIEDVLITLEDGSLMIETSSSTSIIIDPSGLEIYPNPVQHLVNIAANQEISIRIMDLKGQIMFESNKDQAQYQISVEQWSPGTYIIQSTSEQGVTNSRIVVQ